MTRDLGNALKALWRRARERREWSRADTWYEDPPTSRVEMWGQEVRAVLERFYSWVPGWGDEEVAFIPSVWIVGRDGVGKAPLLNALCGWTVADAENRAQEVDIGLFRLFTLDRPPMGDFDAATERDMWGWEGEWPLEAPPRGIAVFVIDATEGLHPVEYRWFGRLRHRGWPVVPVLNKCDVVGDRVSQVRAAVERRLGTRVLAVSAKGGHEVNTDKPLSTALAHALVQAAPELAVPLGREVPTLRPVMAQMLMQSTALWCAVLGLEPMPLVDIPFLVAAHVGLVRDLLRLYGHGGGGGMRGEILWGAVGGLVVRYLAQSAARMVPVLGWLASSALAAGGAWTVGRMTVAYLERQKRVYG